MGDGDQGGRARSGADAGQPDLRPGRRRHRTRRMVIAVLGVVLVVAAGAVAFVVWGTTPPEQASLEEAQQRFTPGTATPGTGPTAERVPPAQGVYRFAGSGSENTSFPPVQEDQGPEMPATVTWTEPGCFTLRIDYNTNHWQEWHLCLTDDALVERGGRTFQRRDYTVLQVDSNSTFVCDPVVVIVRWDADPGDRSDASCVGTTDVLDGSTTSAGTNTFVGLEELDVGGEPVPTYHVHGTRTLRGSEQDGEETWDTWFAADSGMIVRSERSVVVSTRTPFGAVDYDETSEWTLQSMAPVP